MLGRTLGRGDQSQQLVRIEARDRDDVGQSRLTAGDGARSSASGLHRRHLSWNRHRRIPRSAYDLRICHGPYDGRSDADGPLEVLTREEPPAPINWNLLDSDQAEAEWRDLDGFVHWLKTTFGLPPAIVPPYWHRHDELIWELSALHTHFLACFDEAASPSAPIAWMRDFADARHRLRDWVSICGTRLDRDRPTRQTAWPGEQTPASTGEAEITDRADDFEEVVRADVLRRRRIEALTEGILVG